ncbi:MAG: hypothetical protein LBI91_03600 [Spirochaetaceae bacterium]|jgi:hypothetical protein|nr:hypothetical protein [Spirochaetaceae bacterium]
MKIKILSIIILILVFCATGPVFAQNATVNQIYDGTKNFAQAMAEALPLNSSLGLNWSDAYIGKLIGKPPHFGVGASAGFTTVNADAVHDLLGYFSVMLPASLNDLIPLPAYTGELRLGGFGIPFDIGFKAGYLPSLDLGGGTELNYFQIGGDFRYGILEDKGLIPGLSVGFGAYHLTGGIGADLPDQVFGLDTIKIDIENSRGDFTWQSTTLELKAQISKKLLFITPYLGLGANYAWTSAGFAVKGKVASQGEYAKTIHLLETEGLTGIKYEAQKELSSEIKTSGLGFRVFGGFAFNIMAVKIDLTGMADPLHKVFGASLGLRFQL